MGIKARPGAPFGVPRMGQMLPDTPHAVTNQGAFLLWGASPRRRLRLLHAPSSRFAVEMRGIGAHGEPQVADPQTAPFSVGNCHFLPSGGEWKRSFGF